MFTIKDDSPRWKEINVSAWEHERAGLAHIRALLPDADPYLAWANVEFLATDSSINEVDLLVLTPSGLHLIELKHWQGEVDGDGQLWRIKAPNGRTRLEDNPLILANRKARRLASLLEHYNRQSGAADQGDLGQGLLRGWVGGLGQRREHVADLVKPAALLLRLGEHLT